LVIPGIVTLLAGNYNRAPDIRVGKVPVASLASAIAEPRSLKVANQRSNLSRHSNPGEMKNGSILVFDHLLNHKPDATNVR
jgi:hypothetical protein